MSENSKTSWAVKRVIARVTTTEDLQVSAAKVLHAHNLKKVYNFDSAGKMGLAAHLNAEFIRMGEPFKHEIHPTETAVAVTVGDLVEIVRAHRR